MAKIFREVHSAGGVLINNQEQILFCHPTHSRWNNWRMPKGQIEPREEATDAALREVLEETGYKCKILARLLTDVRYKSRDILGSNLKVLHMYLMEPLEKVQEPDWEHDKFVWIDFAKVPEYAALREAPIIEEALEMYKSLKNQKA